MEKLIKDLDALKADLEKRAALWAKIKAEAADQYASEALGDVESQRPARNSLLRYQEAACFEEQIKEQALELQDILSEYRARQESAT